MEMPALVDLKHYSEAGILTPGLALTMLAYLAHSLIQSKLTDKIANLAATVIQSSWRQRRQKRVKID